MLQRKMELIILEVIACCVKMYKIDSAQHNVLYTLKTPHLIEFTVENNNHCFLSQNDV